MRKHGFSIKDMWESRGAAGKTFMAGAEWSAIKRDTSARDGTMVGAIEDRTLYRTDYSPAA